MTVYFCYKTKLWSDKPCDQTCQNFLHSRREISSERLVQLLNAVESTLLRREIVNDLLEVGRRVEPVGESSRFHAWPAVAVGAAARRVRTCACLHQSRILERPRRPIARVLRNRGRAHLYKRPVDDIGIRMIGRDAIEPAKEKGRCANAHDDRQQADQP